MTDNADRQVREVLKEVYAAGLSVSHSRIAPGVCGLAGPIVRQAGSYRPDLGECTKIVASMQVLGQ